MSKRHVFESEGVLFGVDYSFQNEDKVPTIHSVKVLGADYKEIGPDLTRLFRKCLYVHELSKEMLSVEEILSMIAGELK